MTPVICAICLAIGSDIVGAYFSKQYADQGHMSHAVLAVTIYALGTASWCYLLRFWQHGIAITGLVWSVCGVLLIVLLGLWTGERLSLVQTIGVGLSIVGIAMVTRGS